jgi:hypothetical protein
MLHAYVLGLVTSAVKANALAESIINDIITATPNVELVIRFRWRDVPFSVTSGGISVKELEEFLLQQLAAVVRVSLETVGKAILKYMSAPLRCMGGMIVCIYRVQDSQIEPVCQSNSGAKSPSGVR